MSMSDSFDPGESAAHLIYRVGRLFRFRSAAFLAEHCPGLTPEQWRVLLVLNRRGQSSVRDMADPELGDYPNLSRLVDGLVRRGLAGREPSPEDRRVNLVSLTDAGRALVEEILPEMTEEKGRYFQGLDERDVAGLKRVLKIIESNLEKEISHE